MPDLVTQSGVSLFVIPLRGEKAEWVSDRLSIRRVMWRGGKRRQQVIFRCFAKALPEMVSMLEGGCIYVKYIECGVLDNFAIGETMMVFMGIKINEVWLNNLTTLEYANEPVIAHFAVNCLADWHLDGMFTLSTNLYVTLDQLQ